MTLSIILYRPQIPPNTGNIIRLAANTGCDLHLIQPLFPLEDNKLKRAGLDYHEYVNIMVHSNYPLCLDYFNTRRIIAIETCGKQLYTQINFKSNDVLLFGSEKYGLPNELLALLDHNNIVNLPMKAGQRSLNLSNSVAIVVYEAWRQLSFN